MSTRAVVIPANAGIQYFAKHIEFPSFAESFLDPGMRRDDEIASLLITLFKLVWNEIVSYSSKRKCFTLLPSRSISLSASMPIWMWMLTKLVVIILSLSAVLTPSGTIG